MRRFSDRTGAVWEVVVGRESWGAIFAIFVPHDEGEGVRQAPLTSTSLAAASTELDCLDEEQLAVLLASSEPKP